jgi:hypothetical protein
MAWQRYLYRDGIPGIGGTLCFLVDGRTLVVRRIKIDEYNKTKMLSARIPKKTSALNTLRPVLPLITEKSATVEDNKSPSGEVLRYPAQNFSARAYITLYIVGN